MAGNATKCMTCGNIIRPKNGYYECCGIKESAQEVKDANNDAQRPRRSMEDILFRMTHGIYPDQIKDPYYDDFNDSEF